MKRFTRLFEELDQTNKTNEKVKALANYFDDATDADKLWAIALLSGKRPKRSVKTNLLKEWAAEMAEIPYWLFEECYYIVGDLGETVATILPDGKSEEDRSVQYWMHYIIAMNELSDEERKEQVVAAWAQMQRMERFVFNKLIAGSFRVGLSKKLMVRALAQHTGIEEPALMHRIMGKWSPQDTTYEALILEDSSTESLSKPYPFFLAYSIEGEVSDLGDISDWYAERKWDGIRGQLIVRGGELYVWSRGEDLVTDKFPEYQVLRTALPDGTVLDGEIMAFKDGAPLPFNYLQTRIGRKNLSRKILEHSPVVLIAYDVLEHEGRDIREKPLSERRAILEQLVAEANNPVLLLSDIVDAKDWQQLAEEREKSREHLSEGIMLKRKGSAYQVGRKKGDWWKWKVDPLTVDAVMIYAMRGHGRRANLYTDYTFAVWDGDKLVPFAKAYSGLTDKEITQVDAWVKKNTIDRFGPVRSVTPYHVFEIAFEGIQRSTRHKSGIALRFPRISRWRKDKPKEEANTLADLQQLLEMYESAGSNNAG